MEFPPYLTDDRIYIYICSRWNRNSLCATPIVCKHRPCAAAVGRYVTCFISKTVANLLHAAVLMRETWVDRTVEFTIPTAQVSAFNRLATVFGMKHVRYRPTAAAHRRCLHTIGVAHSEFLF